tara:strand:- start:4558 stop:5373 length:816 start_codon:yes stop_codon:yes gene_type:complete
MMKKNNFTVLLPVYEAENPAFLDKCLMSMANQKVKPNQTLICIDQKITLQLEKVINQYKELLNINSIIYKGSSQLGGSLALGVKESVNEIIFRMDADDICHPKRFSIMLDEFTKKKYDVLGSWGAEFDKLPSDQRSIRKTPEQIKGSIGYLRNPFNHPSVMFRKSKVLESGNYRECFGSEDWDLWLRMKKNNAKMGNIPEVLIYQRVGNNFIERRSGLKYLSRRIDTLIIWKKENLIPFYSFIICIFSEMAIRLLPQNLVSFIYKVFLRDR